LQTLLLYDKMAIEWLFFMRLKQYIIVMLLATLLCWASFVVVLFNIDPFTGNGIGFLFFYLSLCFALVGSFSLLFFLAHFFFVKIQPPVYRLVTKSFKQSLLLSIILIFLLFLQGRGLLTIWNLSFFILAVGLFYLLRRSLKEHNHI